MKKTECWRFYKLPFQNFSLYRYRKQNVSKTLLWRFGIIELKKTGSTTNEGNKIRSVLRSSKADFRSTLIYIHAKVHSVRICWYMAKTIFYLTAI